MEQLMVGYKAWDGKITVGQEYKVTDIYRGKYLFIGDDGKDAAVEAYSGYLVYPQY